MNIKELIRDKTCYIVSNEFKGEILSYLNKNKLLLDIHFFSMNQIIERFYFKYDNRAIYFVSKKYNMSFPNAELMINNLKYLMYSNSCDNSKVALLKDIKDELDKMHLLEYEKGFLEYLEGYNIISDLNIGNPFLYKINELLNNKIEFINLDRKEEIIVYEFKDSDEEIAYVANQIGELISKNISPSNIHILNVNDAYNVYIDKIFSLYNIPYKIDSNNVLYELNEYKILYNNFVNNISTLQETEYTSLFNNLVSSLSFIEDENDKKAFLLYILKTQKQRSDKYINIVNFSSYEGIYLSNHYYFFIGLNNKVFPNIKKDEEYISDKIKNVIGYPNSSIINKLTREYCINRLCSDSNLCISYRNNDYFNKYLKSDLVDEIATRIEKMNANNNFSIDYDKVRLTRELDNFYKYNLKSDLLNELLAKVSKSEYKKYDNSYSGVDSKYYLDKILENNISISYTSFEKFNECNYKYYLDNILKENEDNFNTYTGSLFHHVLEHIYDVDFDFQRCVDSYKSEYILSDKEKLLLEGLLDDFKGKIAIILQQYEHGKYKNIKKEENISLYVKSKVSIKITGYIDKIMLDSNNHAYVIDYKTGDTKLTLNYLEYGLRCQLPFYFYLLNKSKEYADIFLVGCYLQRLNFKIRNYTDTSKDMLLEGLTYENEDIISQIDMFYQSDSFIRGIKPNKKGLGTHAKTYNSTDFEKIVTTMANNIEKMINDIENANFKINPKMIKNKETTCTYCNYRDICYRDYKDFIDIRKVNKDEQSDMD